jgi:multiple sugar transport system substrate-binding protein
MIDSSGQTQTQERSSAMKKLVVMSVVIIALALSVSAYAASKEPVNIVFWNVWGGTRAPLLRQILDRFETTHPGIKVENVTLDGNTDTQKMLTAVAGGTVPDIYMTHTNDLSMWANLKAFKSLNDYIKRDNLDLLKTYYPGAVQGSTFSGQVIQLPFKFTSTMMIWYNKELFKAAGLDPEKPPTTWKELEAAAKALTKKRGNVIDQAGLNICINCVKGPEDPFNEWVGRNGGSIMTADGAEIAFDSPRGVETMKWMKSFMDNTLGGFDKFATQFGTDFPENRPAFYAGKLAMTIDGPWALDIFRKEAPQIMNKVGVFLIPINSDNPEAKQQYTAYGVPGYAIPATAKNPDAAWEVLKFIGMEGGCEFFKRQNRTDSPLLTCVDEKAKKDNPFFDTFMAAMNSVKVVNGPPPYNQIQIRFKEMEESVLMGKETPEAGVKKAAEDCRAILRKK